MGIKNSNIVESFLTLSESKKVLADNLTRLGLSSNASDPLPDLVKQIKFFYRMNNLKDSDGANSLSGINECTASGDSSVALGSGAKATGLTSVAMGLNTSASGLRSVALNYGTIASGDVSFASGYITLASGYISTAIGEGTIASGSRSLAAGYQSEASGTASTALGSKCIAQGDRSLAVGYMTRALYNMSNALGYGTRATALAQTAIGRWNSEDNEALLIVGNGTSDSDRKNAFTVNNDGTVSVQSDPYEDMNLSTKRYVDQSKIDSTLGLFKTEGFISNIYTQTEFVDLVLSDPGVYYILPVGSTTFTCKVYMHTTTDNYVTDCSCTGITKFIKFGNIVFVDNGSSIISAPSSDIVNIYNQTLSCDIRDFTTDATNIIIASYIGNTEGISNMFSGVVVDITDSPSISSVTVSTDIE